MTKDMLTKIAVWSIPVLWGAAGVYAQVLGTAEDVEENSDKIESHEDLPGHPIDHQRIQDHAQVMVEIVTEQREMRAEQRDVALSVAAICQATDARCN